MSEAAGGSKSAGTGASDNLATAEPAPPPEADQRIDGPPAGRLGTPVPPRIIRPPAALKPAWILAVIAAAVLTDLALRRTPWNQLATSALITIVAVGLGASGFVTTRSARLMLALAVVFAGFLTWRTGFLLSTFNLLAALGLVTAAAVFGRRGDIWNTGPARLAGGVVSVLEGVLFVPVGAIEETEARYHSWTENGNDTARAVLRGILMATPIVLVLGVLLASADVVFESFFTGFDVRLDDVFGHLALLGIGAAVMVALLRVASRPTDDARSGPGWQLGVVEASVLLGSITVLFAAFSYAQLVTVMGGADEALSRAGLDPKQFARQGFFQLLWVAGITLAVVMAVRVLTDRSDGGRKVVRILGLTTVALTLVIVAVALARISFYVGDSGLTARRLYAAIISVWIAVSFLLVAARLFGVRRDRAWLTPASVLCAVVLLMGLNLANPQKRIAENNLDRNQDVLIWHVRHGQFVGDGRATLADNLDRLSPELATEVRKELCFLHRLDGSDRPGTGLLEFNVGRTKAADAIDRLCR